MSVCLQLRSGQCNLPSRDGWRDSSTRDSHMGDSHDRSALQLFPHPVLAVDMTVTVEQQAHTTMLSSLPVLLSNSGKEADTTIFEKMILLPVPSLSLL